MITQYTIGADEWTAITSAGESGSCWLDEEGNGRRGKGSVRIYHSASGVPTAAKLTEGKKVYQPSGNNDVCIISADSVDDIYYARCKNVGDQVVITVDVI